MISTCLTGLSWCYTQEFTYVRAKDPTIRLSKQRACSKLVAAFDPFVLGLLTGLDSRLSSDALRLSRLTLQFLVDDFRNPLNLLVDHRREVGESTQRACNHEPVWKVGH